VFRSQNNGTYNLEAQYHLIFAFLSRDIDKIIVCYTFGKCTLRLRTLSASSGVSLYTPVSCNAAQDEEMASSLLMLLSEDLSKSLKSTADPGRRVNKIQASLTLQRSKGCMKTVTTDKPFSF